MRSLFTFTLLLFLLTGALAQPMGDTVISISNLPGYTAEENDEPCITINAPWHFMKGDNPAWADSALVDTGWTIAYANLSMLQDYPGAFGGIGWFRIHLNVADEYAGKVLAIMITQSGASEIYLDGKLVHHFGTINTKNPEQEERYDPQFLPAEIVFPNGGMHVIAVRYANARAEDDVAAGRNSAPGFQVKIGKMLPYNEYHFVNSNILTAVFIFYFTFFIALSFLHFVIFLFYRSNKSNLYYTIFTAAFSMVFLCLLSRQNLMDPDTGVTMAYINMFLSNIYGPALIAMLYSIFYGRLLKIFWLWLGLYAIDFVLNLCNVEIPYFGLLVFSIFCVESIRVIIASIIKKRPGAWIIGSGVMVTTLFLLGFILLAVAGQAEIIYTQRGGAGILVGLLVVYLTLSIPIHMSVYLARDFARTSKNLQKKLAEVKELSERSVQQEKEKQKILAEQNEVLEQQVSERTAEIVEQKKVIEEKNKDITDSIHYAKTIQDAMLPAGEFVAQLFPDSFVLFRPKDIVSGDFYWAAQQDAYRYIAAVDCTGHGVPGALMSMTGNNFLNQLVVERDMASPQTILDHLDVSVRKSLRQDRAETESKDGMDIALCRFNNDLTEIAYAGANRPLWIVRNGELLEYRPTKQSIGGTDVHAKFTEHIIPLQRGDTVYIFSDGYADQFGGPEGKKFMSRKMKQMLCEVGGWPAPRQKEFIEQQLLSWMGGITQVDDILVIGIRV